MTKNENGNPDTRPAGCRFPVSATAMCGRPTVAASGDPDGRGRPSNYCENPQHNRAAAWRARRALAEQESGQQEPDEVLSRPVTSAGARASQFLDETRALVETLAQAQERLLRELAVLGDPDATAAELATVTADADEQLAIERRRAAQAEAGRREDRARAEEADAAAAELAEELEALRAAKDAALAIARGELAATERRLTTFEDEHAAQAEQISELMTANAAQFTEIERLTGEVATARADLATSEHNIEAADARNDELETQLTRAQEEVRHLTEQLTAAIGERDEQRRRAEAAETRAEVEAAQVRRLDEDVADLRRIIEGQQAEVREHLDHANRLRTENAGIVAQLEAAKQALAAEQNHGNQRVSDMERTYERQVGELRAEVERLRSGKK